MEFGVCGRPLKSHAAGDLYGIVIVKYNDPEKIVWATNFKWVVKAEGFYEFFSGSCVEPWGPVCGYEKVFEGIEKLFKGPAISQEAVNAFLRKDNEK